MLPMLVLAIQTLLCWGLVFLFYHQKYKITLIPLYTFIGILTLLTHNISDLGFGIQYANLYFLIASVSFFTSLMLGTLILYILEGPRAARLALWVILFTSFFYIALIALINIEVNTTPWISLTFDRARYYYWSLLAIVLDVAFLAMCWEILAKFRTLQLIARIAITVLGTYAIDSFIFMTGVFGSDPRYFPMLYGNLTVRLILALFATPILYFYLKVERFRENERVKPKTIWEILNFRSDLEKTIVSMKKVLEKETNLVQELEKYKLAVHAASDQIVITDNNGIVLFGNPALKRLTGYSEQEALGKKAGILWGRQMSKKFYEHLWHTIKKTKQPYIGELINKRKDGTLYEALLKISPVLNEKHEVIFFVAIERDISREKQLDRMKDEFLSIASHELRTPLTAIDGLVAMIRDGEYGKIDKGIQQPLEDINAASERLIHLVNDLLSVTRIQAGRLKYTLSQFDIQPVLQESVDLLKVIAKKKNISLTMSRADSYIVQADKDKVKQIVHNLIGNALKFTDKGSITVWASKNSDMIQIFIQDTGIGIHQEDQKKLFQKFQQFDTGKGRPPGTGLGLYISKEICKKMGGDLTLIESTIGKGSTFAFFLPIAGSDVALSAEKIIVQESKTVPNQKSDSMISSSI